MQQVVALSTSISRNVTATQTGAGRGRSGAAVRPAVNTHTTSLAKARLDQLSNLITNPFLAMWTAQRGGKAPLPDLNTVPPSWCNTTLLRAQRAIQSGSAPEDAAPRVVGLATAKERAGLNGDLPEGAFLPTQSVLSRGLTGATAPSILAQEATPTSVVEVHFGVNDLSGLELSMAA